MSGSERFLAIYSGFLTALFVVTTLSAATGHSKSAKFDEIEVQRIKVEEPDGTLRMMISNHAKLPGVSVRGTEHPLARSQAGILFYNDEGSENGGLIFGGHRNSKGEVVDSGGSLTFDKYDANQIVQLAGVDDKEDRFAGLIVRDSVPQGKSTRRVWVGRADGGAATLALMDGNGNKRIVVEVPADGTPSISFLDSHGRLLNRLLPTTTQ
jgi:hypothetical protein